MYRSSASILSFDRKAAALFELANSLKLEQLNHSRDLSLSTLDLVFSTIKCSVYVLPECLVKIEECHPPLEIVINSSEIIINEFKPDNSLPIYNLKKGNNDSILRDLSTVNWQELYNTDNLDYKMGILYGNLPLTNMSQNLK